MEFEVDHHAFRTFWPVVTLIINVVFVIVVFALRKTFATKQELSSVKSEHHKLKNSHEQLSKRVETMPTSKEIEKLNVNLEEIRGDMKAIAATQKKADHMLTLLLEHELKEKH